MDAGGKDGKYDEFGDKLFFLSFFLSFFFFFFDRQISSAVPLSLPNTAGAYIACPTRHCGSLYIHTSLCVSSGHIFC